jgi:FAD-dependent oxidoreductase domain-containing protein 1
MLPSKAGVAERLNFVEAGYLTLATASQADRLREAHATQLKAGADWIRLLDGTELADRFPWLQVESGNEADHVVLGSFGEANEGYFDPWALLELTREVATTHGDVEFVRNTNATHLETTTPDKISGLVADDGRRFSTPLVVNAAGAYSAAMTRSIPHATPVPVAARKRCIFVRCFD